MGPRQVISTELARATIGVLISSPRARVLSPPRHWARSPLKYPRSSAEETEQILTIGCSPQFLTTTVWRRLWERQFSMHLRSRNLPRPSASSPLDNKAPPMANTSQVPDLEGLRHEIHGMAEQMRVMNENNARLIQLLTAANPQPPAAPSVPDVELSRHSNRSGDRSHNVSTERARGRRRAPSPSLRERSSSSKSSQTQARVRRGRSPNRGDHTGARDKSTSQTDPPFTERVLRARISSKFKLPTQLGIYEGKTDPMDHLDSYKSLMSLQGCSDEVMCKAFSATLKGPARTPTWPAVRLHFQKCSRNFIRTPEQSRQVYRREELIEAKRRRRGKDDHKRKEPDTRRADYREETRYKRPDRDPKRSNDRRPRTPPRRLEFTLPPLNAPVAQVLSEIKNKENKIADLIKRVYLRKYVAARPPPNSPERSYSDNRPTAGDIQTIHGGFGSGGYSTSSRKRHARSAHRPAEEEVYNLSSSFVADQTRNQGDYLDLSPEAKVSHPNRDWRDKGRSESGQAMLHLGHEGRNLFSSAHPIAITEHG
ncbi:hypothetical protein Acr_28g0001850 [Actinidia rufa]|uniref:Uncharacterized protein n=1 Tax=Actinidia rufa TaxID=165716 RepID=A0A7J0H8P6_9ERIC|nr:hypothetical protein Acr_28g0001850 [Actinidia rufa]